MTISQLDRRHVAGVAATTLVAVLMIWGGIALVNGDTHQLVEDHARPLKDRIQLVHHMDENGNLEGYQLLKDDRILLMVWDDNGDGLLSMWEYYTDGESDVLVQDRNGDRRLDWWQIRTGPEEATLARDDDYDGIVDSEEQIRFVTKY